MQRVNLYGEVIDVTDGEAEGVIDFLLGREYATECAPLGYTMAPIYADDDWRRGYAMAVFGISDRTQLEI
jgi:hypothetical protein